MSTEANSLQQTIEQLGHRGKILAIASGKGGVGKTNIAANLGLCLAASGKKILLVDADSSLGNLDVVLNINSRYNISHVIKGQKSIQQIIHFDDNNLGVICGTSGGKEYADINEFLCYRLLHEICTVCDDSDLIIIDTAAGISNSVISFCTASNHALVVTTPEPTAITDAYALIKVLSINGFSGQISLIVNMAENLKEGKKTYQQIANVARRFLNVDVYEAGVLLRDERLISALRQRKPVVQAYPKANITVSIAALGARLISGLAVQAPSGGFFRRLQVGFSKVVGLSFDNKVS